MLTNTQQVQPSYGSRWQRLLVIVFVALPVMLTISCTPVATPDTNDNKAEPLPSVVSVPSSAPLPVWPTPGVVTQKRSVPMAAPPQRMVYGALGIDTQIATLPLTDEVRKGVITWPNEPQGYWVDLWGMPGSGATDMTMIVGHSCEGLDVCRTIDWQFTKLSNNAQLGDTIAITTKNGVVNYTVDQIVARIPKSELPQHAEIFGTTPMECRLVVITCDTNDINAENYVITAKRESCS